MRNIGSGVSGRSSSGCPAWPSTRTGLNPAQLSPDGIPYSGVARRQPPPSVRLAARQAPERPQTPGRLHRRGNEETAHTHAVPAPCPQHRRQPPPRTVTKHGLRAATAPEQALDEAVGSHRRPRDT